MKHVVLLGLILLAGCTAESPGSVELGAVIRGSGLYVRSDTDGRSCWGACVYAVQDTVRGATCWVLGRAAISCQWDSDRPAR